MRASVLLALAALAACRRGPGVLTPVGGAAAPGASAGGALADSSRVASRFQDEIERFEAADRVRPPAPGGVVFVGSSSIRLWPDLAAAFPGVPVLNRGFGGSTLPEVLRYAPRVVLPYRPRLVVLYAGDNDLAEGRTPEHVAGDYRRLVARLRREVPAVRVAFVAIKPSPSRRALMPRVREANRLIRAEVERDGRQRYVDVFTPMLRADGEPRPELFQADSLHMTAAGYALWRERLADVVR
jgi:lysophospholipase L1-like esterase